MREEALTGFAIGAAVDGTIAITVAVLAMIRGGIGAAFRRDWRVAKPR